MKATQFIGITYYKNNEYNTRNRIVCNDGFSFSVQASKGHYCSPRVNTYKYESVEVGFPSDDEPIIFQYAENNEDYKNTVYGWVPIELIEEIISKHKGIDIDKTFKL